MTNAAKNWIITINAHHAQIFSRPSDDDSAPVKLVQELKAGLDSSHEKPGTGFSGGNIRHGVAPHTDRREVEKEQFAREIHKFLKKSHDEKLFDKLILVASPKMMGILESIFDKHLHQAVTAKLTKDIAEFSVQEIKEYLTENL